MKNLLDFRAKCGLQLATDFSDLSDTMSQDQIDKLTSVYNHVDDIDLYIAGLMETPTSGSLLGPTFSCIIADQVKGKLLKLSTRLHLYIFRCLEQELVIDFSTL